MEPQFACTADATTFNTDRQETKLVQFQWPEDQCMNMLEVFSFTDTTALS